MFALIQVHVDFVDTGLQPQVASVHAVKQFSVRVILEIYSFATSNICALLPGSLAPGFIHLHDVLSKNLGVDP